MNYLLSSLMLLFFIFAAIATGEDKKTDKSSGPIPSSGLTRVANQVDTFQAELNALEREHQDEIKTLEGEFRKKKKQLRTKVLAKLNSELTRLTKAGDLDSAVAVRQTIQKLSQQERSIEQPIEFDAAKLREAIEGRWRWNNGTDITNFAGGKTSGLGKWRIVDAKRGEFEFQWSRIPADRVIISSNGRVLEGAKANNPKFRVWAVRID